jgi:hypothetical protein
MRLNTAVFLVLLVEDKLSQDLSRLNYQINRNRVTLSGGQRLYLTEFLWGVLEHHNTPGQFNHRETFITHWRDHQLELFNFTGRKLRDAGRAYSRLSRDWASLLESNRNTMSPAAFEARFGNFVGVIMSGDETYQSQRDQSNLAFSATKLLSDSIPAPHKAHWTTMLEAMETPFDSSMIADLNPQEDPRHVCSFDNAVGALEAVEVQDIMELLEAQFA